MELLLKKYRVIAKPDFIDYMEDKFYNEHFSKLEKEGLYAFKEEKEKRIMVMGVDMEGNDFSAYVTFDSFLISEYSKLEKEAHAEIHNFLLTILEEREKKGFIKNIIEEIQKLQKTINETSVESRYSSYKKNLLGKVISFSKSLQDIYQQKKVSYNSDRYDNPKIKWLGTAKQLGTLFYDLLYGQKGTAENPEKLKPLIDANKGELIHFLAKNFVYSDGSEMKPSTFDGILTDSEDKNDERANKDRIELSYPPPKRSKKP